MKVLCTVVIVFLPLVAFAAGFVCGVEFAPAAESKHLVEQSNSRLLTAAGELHETIVAALVLCRRMGGCK